MLTGAARLVRLRRLRRVCQCHYDRNVTTPAVAAAATLSLFLFVALEIYLAGVSPQQSRSGRGLPRCALLLTFPSAQALGWQ